MPYGDTAYAGEAFTGLAGAAAPASVNPIEFLLYDELNQNYLGLLDLTKEREWSDPFNDAGGGKFKIGAEHPLAVGQLTDANGKAVYDHVVRCRLNGTVRYAFIIKENDKATAKADEEVGRLLSIAGPGTLAFFQRATVYPERGIGRISPDSRLFNWTAFSFNDSSWVAAQQVLRYDTPVPGGAWNNAYGVFPKDFPDPTAYWIWGASGSATTDALPGDVYFRKFFSLVRTTPVKFAFTCDDSMEIFIDNAFVTAKPGQAWTQAAAVDMLLDSGVHLIAVKGHNATLDELGGTGGGTGYGTNTAGMILAMHVNAYGTAANGTDFGAMLMHTDNSWKVLQYPPGGPPGMTPGEILRVLFTEAQTRGALPGVTWTFTDANDSAGNPWAVTPDFGVQVGTTYYALLRQLAEVSCDLHMDPNSLRIDVFNQRGTTKSVTLQIANNIDDLEHQGTGDIINAAIMRYFGGWRESTLPASIGAHGRHEGFLSLGVAPSLEQGDLAAQALFGEMGNPRDAIVTTHEGRPGSGTEPYAAYDVADTITAPTRAGANSQQVVKAITVHEDAEGNPIFTPELQALSEQFESRVQRWVKRMSAGTASGQSESAAPFMPSSSQQEKVLPPAALTSGGTGFRYATQVVAAVDSVNPTDADFVCTGTNDDVKINAAIDSLPPGGGRVLLMEGTYHVSSCITALFGSEKVILQGMGQGTQILVDANMPVVLNDQRRTGNVIDFVYASGGIVKDLYVNMQGKTGFGCVSVTSTTRSRGYIENVVVENPNLYDFNGSFSGSGSAFHLSSNGFAINCEALAVTGNGFEFAGGASGDHGGLIACRAGWNNNTSISRLSGVAVRLGGAGPLFITSCDLGGNSGCLGGAGGHNGNGQFAGTAIGNRLSAVVNGPVVYRVDNAVYIGNHMIGNGNAHVIEIGADNDGIIASNWIQISPFASTKDGINVGTAAARNQILGNWFDGSSPRTGIRFEAGSGGGAGSKNVAVGNVFNSCPTAINDLAAAGNNVLAYAGGALGDNISY